MGLCARVSSAFQEPTGMHMAALHACGLPPPPQPAPATNCFCETHACCCLPPATCRHYSNDDGGYEQEQEEKHYYYKQQDDDEESSYYQRRKPNRRNSRRGWLNYDEGDDLASGEARLSYASEGVESSRSFTRGVQVAWQSTVDGGVAVASTSYDACRTTCSTPCVGTSTRPPTSGRTC
jgi:hypothetical protein